jgi:hypothetical protein
MAANGSAAQANAAAVRQILWTHGRMLPAFKLFAAVNWENVGSPYQQKAGLGVALQ